MKISLFFVDNFEFNPQNGVFLLPEQNFGFSFICANCTKSKMSIPFLSFIIVGLSDTKDINDRKRRFCRIFVLFR